MSGRNEIKSDVLVIGGGIAGSSTALPSGPTPMLSAKREKSILGMTLIQKNTRTASEISVMTSVTLNESSSPKTLSARNIA